MKTRFAFAAAALATGLAFATPAAADQQRYAPRYDSRADYGYGYGYGYRDRADVRQLRYRVSEIRRDIDHFARRGMITRREANKLMDSAHRLDRRIARSARNGMNRGEWRSAQEGIRRLQNEIRHDLRDRGDGRDDRYGRYSRGQWQDDRWDDYRYRDHDRYDRRDRDDDDDRRRRRRD